MVKAIWAVACSTALAALIIAGLGGCASAPRKADAAAAAGTSTSGDEGTAAAENATPPVVEDRPVPPASAPPAALPGTAYRIGPEDMLHISVWDNKELTLDVVVRPDGMISIPLVQDVLAEGLTAAELADVLHLKLLAFVKEPQVFVIVTQVNAPKVYVIGNVPRPGPYPLRGNMSVLQVLSLAGGFTPFASPKKIKVVRASAGKQEVRKANFYEIIDEGVGNYYLMPGDTIVVP